MLLAPERLNERARTAIATTDNAVLISVVSVWEAAIKHSIGKLPLPGTVANLVNLTVRDFDVELLPIGLPHVLNGAALPLHHKDPFDRLLVGQSQLEGATLVTADEAIRHYGTEILWAT
jgi:PIN domain nuclease of toxin-antitoxin system